MGDTCPVSHLNITCHFIFFMYHIPLFTLGDAPNANGLAVVEAVFCCCAAPPPKTGVLVALNTPGPKVGALNLKLENDGVEGAVVELGVPNVKLLTGDFESAVETAFTPGNNGGFSALTSPFRLLSEDVTGDLIGVFCCCCDETDGDCGTALGSYFRSSGISLPSVT